MMSGSARLESTAAAKSLRHTSMLRRHTGTQRISVPQIAAGQLEEHVLEARRTVQVSELRISFQVLQHRSDVMAVAEHGIAHPLEARREPARALRPLLDAGSVHLDHLR